MSATGNATHTHSTPRRAVGKAASAPAPTNPHSVVSTPRPTASNHSHPHEDGAHHQAQATSAGTNTHSPLISDAASASGTVTIARRSRTLRCATQSMNTSTPRHSRARQPATIPGAPFHVCGTAILTRSTLVPTVRPSRPKEDGRRVGSIAAPVSLRVGRNQPPGIDAHSPNPPIVTPRSTSESSFGGMRVNVSAIRWSDLVAIGRPERAVQTVGALRPAARANPRAVKPRRSISARSRAACTVTLIAPYLSGQCLASLQPFQTITLRGTDAPNVAGYSAN
jgi:hypothetical protein